mmetsp:Transcript_76691/g.194613  ORF Transcript_76691/g.194613 Transcript_76691/m.194613 type:complete len:247 (+) Transcript_76691:592-1332(+)
MLVLLRDPLGLLVFPVHDAARGALHALELVNATNLELFRAQPFSRAKRDQARAHRLDVGTPLCHGKDPAIPVDLLTLLARPEHGGTKDVVGVLLVSLPQRDRGRVPQLRFIVLAQKMVLLLVPRQEVVHISSATILTRPSASGIPGGGGPHELSGHGRRRDREGNCSTCRQQRTSRRRGSSLRHTPRHRLGLRPHGAGQAGVLKGGRCDEGTCRPSCDTGRRAQSGHGRSLADHGCNVLRRGEPGG